MKIFSTLRTRLLVTYLGLLVLGFGGLTLFAGRQIESSIYTDFISSQKVRTFLISSAFSSSFHEESEEGIAPSRLDAFLQSTAQEAGAEIAILNQSGVVVADSTGRLVGEELGNTPEIIRANNGQNNEPVNQAEVASAKAGTMVYTAAQLQGEYGPIGFVRLASSTDKPKSAARQQWLTLGGAFVIFSILGTLISLWLLSTLTKPLNILRNTALRMAGGDLAQRVSIEGKDEIGEVGQAFNEMATQVESMVAEQRAFAANASHELRTPLTTIRLRTEALQSGHLDKAKSQQYINEIEHETQRMGGLVSDLILLSRLDAQQFAVGQEEVQVERIVQSVASELADMAQAKGVALTVERPLDRYPTVTATTSHIQVIVRNLLDNAIKYTPEGGAVAATVTIVDVAMAGQMIELQISDNGQGVSTDELPHITQRFYRADKAHSRDIEGVGLGLPLVKSIVELYGGEFNVQSKGLGHGTTVTVCMPVSTDSL